ncbi:MAG: alkaline phosphatase family protein [Candidatus Heimdallarchaeota archaeon]|nr:alkaline phosphatase family protein [Candidatus Heimdallarchaeota archaeon]MCK4769996.1 alkaline phosphatase family protein [Candidatus Heimdallarchaeota archaeon]
MKNKKYKVILMAFFLVFVIYSPITILSYVGELEQPSLAESNTISRIVVFSIDAFRHDYFDKTDLPAIEWLIEQGIKAEYCIPSNPSVTAVNHVSMITGNHPDEHGVLGNTYFDWEDSKAYSLFDDATDPYRDTNTGLHLLTAEPAIIHAEDNAIVTMAVGWPYVESGTLYEGKEPEYVFDYDYLGTNQIRTNGGVATKVVDVIKNHPEIGLVFATMPGVDFVTHNHGTESYRVDDVLENVDNAITRFLEEMERSDLLKETVVVLASDHGMADVADDQYFLDEKSFFINAETQTGISPYIAHDAAFDLLYFIGETNVSKVEEFADYLRGGDGIQAVYVNEANSAIDMNHVNRGVNISVFLEPGRSSNFGGSYEGMHGYLNNNTDMHGIFVAAGPGIKQNVSVPGMNIIDIAPTVLDLLEIESGFSSVGTILTNIQGSRSEDFSFPVEDEEPTDKTIAVVLPLLIAIFGIPTIQRLRKKRT